MEPKPITTGIPGRRRTRCSPIWHQPGKYIPRWRKNEPCLFRIMKVNERKKQGVCTHSAACCLCVLQFKQGLFALDSPAIAAHVTIGTNHPVAGNGDCHRVSRTGASDGASGGGLSDRPGDVAIGTSRAAGD